MSAASNLNYVPISIGASGTTSLVAAPNTAATGLRPQFMSIWGMAFVVNTATNITFMDGSTNLTGSMAFTANGALTWAWQPGGMPMFKISPYNAFQLNSSVAAGIGGWLIYSIP